jgi:hypothetical protein
MTDDNEVHLSVQFCNMTSVVIFPTASARHLEGSMDLFKSDTYTFLVVH